MIKVFEDDVEVGDDINCAVGMDSDVT
ncbi:hypothetical protein NPIL_406991, partial [Nephila pilipes]